MGASSGSSAQRQAQRAEDERRAQITRTTQNVNDIFNAPERQKQYADFGTALRTRYTEDANRQKSIADRNQRFSLARSGLSGGSAQVDAQRTLGEEYTRGLLQGEEKAQAGVRDLQSQDDAARLNLIQLAQSGLDATTAAQRANAAVAQSAQAARAGAVTGGLGDIFGQTSSLYKQQQEAAARRAGALAPVGTLYGRP